MFSIFGLLLMIFIIFYITKNISNDKISNNMFFISIISLLVLDIGFIAKIGTFTIEYNYFFSLINGLFVINYFWKKRKKIEKKELIIILIFISMLFISMLLPLIFNKSYYSVSFNDSWDLYFESEKNIGMVGLSSHSLGMLARVLIFIFSTYVFFKSVKTEEIKKYSIVLYKISFILIAISIIEFIITNFVNAFSFRKCLLFLFGESDSTYILPRTTFGDYYAPMAFMREPSSYVRAMFIFALNNIYVFIDSKNTKRERIKVLISVLLIILFMFFSKSLSGYIYILGLLFITWCLIDNKKIKIITCMVTLVFLICVVILLKDRAIKIFNAFNYFDTNPNILPRQSELIRLYSINNNLNLFINNVFFGCGFGTVYCYSSIITLITNIGIIGTTSYIYTINHISNKIFKKEFFSWLTFITIIITSSLIGHMSYIIYLETFAYEIMILKSIDYGRKEKKNIN